MNFLKSNTFYLTLVVLKVNVCLDAWHYELGGDPKPNVKSHGLWAS